MGKGAAPFRVNTKRDRNEGQCFEEMNAFFNCMAKFTDVEDKCAAERRALTNCATAAARRGKQLNTVNFHLQRISRMIRR
ncbi:hypothetical protein ABPG77_009073 [Micractinium sp. CCAP 211/92]